MDGKKTLPTSRSVKTASGRISYMERGSGPVALFVHGVLLNGYLWWHQLRDLSDIRRGHYPRHPPTRRIKDAKIFFPEERFEEFDKELRDHWLGAQQKAA
jgi:hypothetical protein